uniref:dachshund homolog 1 isoform X1 n=2 Tax=Ciona intestinalis TaxID=7719 RepID=UPI0002B8D6C6|nr:dachshund homolog 1 isoform X1 [Ciona intestinalis]|eukprot:XP_004226882.1 dachshund homolog 1 isoform X1 [Ciona intestinalis]
MPMMPHGLTMHGKWDSVTMAAPQLHPYKMDRPAYSTPPPVENTPSNNECRMVELRGSKVASFSLGCDEYICLPQAFDLFLKHLVGGLHTVYTKLKRLSIAPVVCNVEQVRILRGLGAIQPGVNRCKLITRKDFEILYQDCTTASRPGRPPKRYPMLPPTTDLMSHHANMRVNTAVANSLMNQGDISMLHKRMRLDHGLDQPHERRTSGSPGKDDDKDHSSVNNPMTSDLHNPTANLAYLQAIRHQYQQAAASGLHNGLEHQQINPALAPFIMMSHPSLFSSGIPPTSMAMLNHINQLAQSHAAGGAMSSAAAAAAAAQIAAGGSALHSNLAQSGSRANSQGMQHEKDSDEEMHTPRSYQNAVSNGIGSDGRTSPSSSVGSVHETQIGDNSGNCGSFDNRDSQKDSHDDKSDLKHPFNEVFRESGKRSDAPFSSDASHEGGKISSMQNLLRNIQGLLKVAADNASLQEKHSSIEIAELNMKLNRERDSREDAEKKLDESERLKADALRRLNNEKKMNKVLQSKLLSMQQTYGNDVNNNENDLSISSPQAASPPNSGGELPADSPPPASGGSTPSYPTPTTFEAVFSARIAAAVQQATGNHQRSPSLSPTSVVTTNVNNNNSSETASSPDFSHRGLVPEHRAADLSIELGVPGRQEHSDHAALHDARMYFKNAGMIFQPAASQ